MFAIAEAFVAIAVVPFVTEPPWTAPVTVALPLAVKVATAVVPVEVIPVSPVALVPLKTVSRLATVVSELILVAVFNVAISATLS